MCKWFDYRKNIIQDYLKNKLILKANEKYPYLEQSDLSLHSFCKVDSVLWEYQRKNDVWRTDKYSLVCHWTNWKIALFLKLYDWDLEIAFHNEENVDKWILTNYKEAVVSEGA